VVTAGRHDQQQAADRATAQRVLDTAPLLDLGGAIAAALARARREGEIHAWEVAQGHVEEAEHAVRELVAAARAEEAARWQAKIEAVLSDRDVVPRDVEIDLRALLDGEQR
jgi:hypothetical protein